MAKKNDPGWHHWWNYLVPSVLSKNQGNANPRGFPGNSLSGPMPNVSSGGRTKPGTKRTGADPFTLLRDLGRQAQYNANPTTSADRRKQQARITAAYNAVHGANSFKNLGAFAVAEGLNAAHLPSTTTGTGTSTSFAKQLENFKFTDPSVVDQWVAAANPGGLAQTDINNRVAGLADIGKQFATGAQRVATQGADLTAKQAAADQNFMALAASYAPKVEEETPAVRAAAAGQATAQNTTMGTRAQGNAGVMNEISQVQGQQAQDQQNAVATGQNQVRSQLGAETENQNRIAREAAYAKYQLLHSKETADYTRLAQLASNESDQAIAQAKLDAGGGLNSTAQSQLYKQNTLGAKLQGDTGEAANKFKVLLDALNAQGGNAKAAVNQDEVAGYAFGDQSDGQSENLYNQIAQAYVNSGGSGKATTAALRNFYRQQGYTDAASMRPWIDQFYANAPLKKKRKRPK